MGAHRLVLGTHSRDIHLLEVNLQKSTCDDENISIEVSSNASINLVSSLRLEEQPSWLEKHPKIPGIIYVNSWVKRILYAIRVETDGRLQLLDQVATTGAGPTHFVVSLSQDSAALIVVTYEGGTVERHPLDTKTGLFINDTPSTSVHKLPRLQKQLADTRRSRERQGVPHPHQVIPMDDGSFLIPDLGNDCLWYLRWDSDRWHHAGRLDVPAGYGPRHGTRLFLLHELASVVTVHSISQVQGNSATVSSAIQTLSTLPAHLATHLSDSGGFDFIACTILLTCIEGKEFLLVSNRNAHLHLVPEGDAIAVFPVCANQPAQDDLIATRAKETSVLGAPAFVTDLGWHLRGFALKSLHSPAYYPTLAVAMGRNGGGITLMGLERGGEIHKLANVAFESVTLPVAGLWLD